MAEINNIQKDNMNIVIVGHVDHGKSTVIGRLLADTDSLPEGKLEAVQENCRRNSKPFEYAFLLDALKDEQDQGITIDAARCFFNTKKRNYIIIDAPGHIEFLKNMVTGASRADAALLVIDAHEGIKENSKRHGYLLSMLGIKQVTVLVNKMDLINYDKTEFERIKAEYTEFLSKVDINPVSFIPIAGLLGENIANKSEKLSWYEGKNVLDTLDGFQSTKSEGDKPFRMFVQAVYKFTRDGDNRRIVAGSVETGSLKVGDNVIFYPSGKKSKVKSIEGFNKEATDVINANEAVGFTLDEQIYIKRGELAVKEGEIEPKVTTRVRTNIFWLGKAALEKDKEYLIKIGTFKTKVRLEEVTRVIDAVNLGNSKKDKIERHDVGECILKFTEAAAFDLTHEIANTSRFVIIDNYEITGGGIITEALEDENSRQRANVINRNSKWQKSLVTTEDRAETYNQKSALILITGENGTGRRDIARNLEKKLFTTGKKIYYLGIGNIIHGLSADLEGKSEEHKDEHIRRVAETANILLDAGIILIVTAIELSQKDIEIIKTGVGSEKVNTFWIGENVTTDIEEYTQIESFENFDEAVLKIKSDIQDKGIIFKF